MDLSSYPVPHPQVAARVVDGSAVIVLADRGEVTILNEVGTRIWELADSSRNVRQIADMIQAEFDVSADDALRDVQAFLQTLADAQAIAFKEHPGDT